MLESIGVRPDDELAYRELLTRVEAEPSALAQALGRTDEDVERSLAALEELGLVTRLPGRRPRVRAARPDLAVDALVSRRRAELIQTQAAARALLTVMPAEERHRPEDIVEVVVGRRAIADRFAQLIEGTREELLVLDRPPYVADAERSDASVRGLLDAEVTVRGIYAPEALEVPGALEAAQQAVRSGEHSRVHPDLPMKLAIADRRVALLPIDADDAVDAALCIRRSALLDALAQLFDALWEQALPIVAPSPEDETGALELAALLATGVKDDVVARHLGSSTRTLSRRVSDMMDILHVRTRFQAGVQAVRCGWLPLGDASSPREGADDRLLEAGAVRVGGVQAE